MPSSSGSLLPTPYPLSPPALAIDPGRTPTPLSDPSPSPTASLTPLPPLSPMQQAFLSAGLSPPAIMGFVGIGVIAFGALALCTWRKVTGRSMPSFMPRRYINSGALSRRGGQQQQQQRQRGDSHGSSKEKPVLFEAWTVRTMDVAKWEESVPFSATLFTEGVEGECQGMAETVVTLRAGEDDDDDEGVEKESEEQLAREEGTESRLRVAVLLQMPSLNRAGTHNKVNEDAQGCSVRGELAIGLMEVPWTSASEDHYSRNGKAPSL